MPKTVTFLTADDQQSLLDRINVLEVAESQRQERHERKLEPDEMVDMALKFERSPWFDYVEDRFVRFKYDGYYNADDEETHIFDSLCKEFDKSTAYAFRSAYSPIKSVVTRLLMRKHPWARPPVKSGDRCVTKIRSCKADPYLWKMDPMGYSWLREWHDRRAAARAKRKKSNDGSTD